MAELPDWTPLDGVAPPPSGGRVVGLVASRKAAALGWAPSAALALSRAWSREGRRVILVDGALQLPSLHEAAGVGNHEGLSDAALHGASVGRVSHALDEGSFFLITAGTPVADSRDVVRSGRWHRLAEGITDAGALLLLYLRDGEASAAAFLGSASDIIVLAGPEDGPPGAVGDLTPMVRAVAGFEDGRARAKGGAPAPSAPPGAGASVPGGASPARQAAPARGASPAPSRAVEAEGGIGKVFLLLVGALLVAAALGYLLTSLL